MPFLTANIPKLITAVIKTEIRKMLRIKAWVFVNLFFVFIINQRSANRLCVKITIVKIDSYHIA